MTMAPAISSDDLVGWAEQSSSTTELAELVKRLLLATTELKSLEDFQTGQGTSQNGLDGRVWAQRETTFCPSGRSVWELSTQRDAKKKLKRDYDKRLELDQSFRATHTYVAVTCRRIPGKVEWVENRVKDRAWKNVRALDAEDLATWLTQAPAVASWFANKHLQRPTYELSDVGSTAEAWSRHTAPPLPLSLLLENRKAEIERVQEWFERVQAGQGEGALYIQAATADEARAFAYAVFLEHVPETMRERFLAMSAVVNSHTAWNWAIRQSVFPTVLIPTFFNPELVGYVNLRNRAIFAIDNKTPTPGRSVIQLKRQPWRLLVKHLTSRRCGLAPGDATAKARDSQGDLVALRRSLGLATRPPWVKHDDSAELIALALVGAWHPHNRVDVEAITRLGANPAKLEALCTKLMQEDEAPIEQQIDGGYSWKSHVDAWVQLDGYISALTTLDNFVELATKTLQSPDKQRFFWVAVLPGDSGLPSSELQSGVVVSVGLLGAKSSFEHIAVRIVQNVLQPQWEHWFVISQHLPTLAESAPDTFLEAVESSLALGSSGVEHLLHQDQGGFGSPPHLGLLNALEILAWSEEYAARVANILVTLAERDPGGQYSNRPKRSLVAMFHLAFPQTSLEEGERFALLRTLAETNRKVGWELLRSVKNSYDNRIFPSSTPKFRAWQLPRDVEPTEQDIVRRVKAVYQLLRTLAGNDGSRWADLVKLVPEHDFQVSSSYCSIIEELINKNRSLENLPIVWETLLREIHMIYATGRQKLGTSSESSIDWTARLKVLERAREALTPGDIIVRHAWKFSSRRLIPEPHQHLDFHELEKKEALARDEVLSELLSGDLNDVMKTLVALLEYDESTSRKLGVALAGNAKYCSMLEPLLIKNAPPPKLEPLVVPFARRRYAGQHKEWLRNCLSHWLSNGRESEALKLVLEIWPQPAVWDVLDEIGDPLKSRYWGGVELLGDHSENQWERAVSNLLQAGNTSAALQNASFRRTHLSAEIILQALNAHSPSKDDAGPFWSFLDDLFHELNEKLDSHRRVAILAPLELKYIQNISTFPNLSQELEENPEEFLRLVDLGYRRDSEVQGTREARVALHKWRGWPGRSIPTEEREGILETWASTILERESTLDDGAVIIHELARVLARSGLADDGHWPCLAVRRLLEKHQPLRRELRKQKLNQIWGRARFASLSAVEDRETADQFDASARFVRSRWPYTESLLRTMANALRSHASSTENFNEQMRLNEGYPSEAKTRYPTITESEKPVDKPESISLLRTVETQDVGPAQSLRLELASRLNILTGDNGLGKTFMLDVLWWALTGTWASRPAWPSKEARRNQPAIRAWDSSREIPWTSVFNPSNEQWDRPPGWPEQRSPVIYIGLDNYSVWDPVRNSGDDKAYIFTKSEVWEGLRSKDGRLKCEGLIDDWGSWATIDTDSFTSFENAVGSLSEPSSMLELKRIPIRVYKGDVKRYPAIATQYGGEIPITHLSAGYKRVLVIAYLLVWTWTEHMKACELDGSEPATRIVLLFDEVEAHLHPRWQRELLPALLEVAKSLSRKELDVQLVASTHSPFVPASLEPHFDVAQDRLWKFELSGDLILLDELEWSKKGDVSAWLTSEVFDLKRATSPEAERAMQVASQFMDGELDGLPVGLNTEEAITKELRRVLAVGDPLWIRWHQSMLDNGENS